MSTHERNKIKGATMIEYAIIVGLIAIAVTAIVTTLGKDVKTLFTTIDTAVKAA